MDIVRYISISLAGLLAGAAVGFIGGLSLGWLLALGYHRQGPSDPGDAPAYVTIGLTLVGVLLGAVVGLAIAVVLSIRLARGRREARNLQNEKEATDYAKNPVPGRR
jgi:hypothetical protein